MLLRLRRPVHPSENTLHHKMLLQHIINLLASPLSTATSSSPPPSLSHLISTLVTLEPPHRALTFFKQASSKPNTKPHIAQLYSAIIHIITSAKMYPEANCLTKELIAKVGFTAFDALRSFTGPKSTPEVFNVLIISLSQINFVNEATRVFYEVKDLPVIQACNCLLNSFIKLGRLDFVWKLYADMLHRGLQPNVFTYNILINTCRHQCDIPKALHLLDEMVSKRIDPTVHTYTTLICSLCENGDLREATELFRMMNESGVSPNLYTYNALMDGHFKDADVSEALALYGRMLQDDLMPNDVTFATLIDGLCKHGRTTEARKVFFLDMAKYGVLPTVPIYNCLIDGFSKLGNLDEAFKLYVEMRKTGFSPDAFTHGILIKGLCDAKRVKEAADLLSKMRQDRISANSVVYNTLIDGYCKEGNLEEAMEACSQMSEEGIEPNVITFSSLIDGHCKKGEMETAMGIFSEMVAKGFMPDVVTYTTLIDGYSRSGNLEKVSRLEKEMVETGVTPNVVTFTCLIDGLCREGKTRDAINLFLEKTSSPDFKPNSRTYMALIYGLYRDGQYFKAGRFYSFMRESGLVPDVVTYILLMRGQCQFGYVLNAMMLQADMLKIGAMPEDWYTSSPDGLSVDLDRSVEHKLGHLKD